MWLTWHRHVPIPLLGCNPAQVSQFCLPVPLGWVLPHRNNTYGGLGMCVLCSVAAVTLWNGTEGVPGVLPPQRLAAAVGEAGLGLEQPFLAVSGAVSDALHLAQCGDSPGRPTLGF